MQRTAIPCTRRAASVAARIVIVGALLPAWAARAEQRVDLGEGIVVVNRGVGLDDTGAAMCPDPFVIDVAVTRGDVRVALPLAETSWDLPMCPMIAATPARDAVIVSYDFMMDNSEGRESYPRETLLAMVANAEGQRAIAAGRREDGIASLLRAVALLPDRPDYRFAAIKALSGAGRRPEALALVRATPLKAQVPLLLDGLADADMPWLMAEADTAAWQKKPAPPHAGGVTLPLMDEARGLAVIGPRWQTRIFAGEDTELLLVDVATLRVLRTGRAGAWLPLLLALGFEPPLDYVTTGADAARFPSSRLSFMCGGKNARILANGHNVGEATNGCRTWGMGSSSPRPELALFANGVLVRNDFYYSCHENAPHEGRSFVPLTKPGTERFNALVAQRAVRAALARDEVDAALAVLAALPPAERRGSLIDAWKAVAESRHGDVAQVARRVAAMPFPWNLLVATHPSAAPELIQAPALAALAAATPGTATTLPAFDPTRRVLAWADETRPDTVTFIDAKGRATYVTGLPVTEAFLHAAGFMAPLARREATGAATGHWRAVGPGGLRLVCDADDDLVLSRDGKGLVTGHQPCEHMERPNAVWFFEGAAFLVGEVALEESGSERTARALIVR